MTEQISLIDERTWKPAKTPTGFDVCRCCWDASIGTERVEGYFLQGHTEKEGIVAHVAQDFPWHPANTTD